MEFLYVFVFGFLAGDIAHKIITRLVTHKIKGYLKIDMSDTMDGPHMFVSLSESVEDISKCKNVTFKVETTRLLNESHK